MPVFIAKRPAVCHQHTPAQSVSIVRLGLHRAYMNASSFCLKPRSTAVTFIYFTSMLLERVDHPLVQQHQPAITTICRTSPLARRFRCDPIHRYINKSGSSTLVGLIRLLGAAVPAAVAAVVAAAVFDLPRFAASDYRVTPAIGRVVRH